MDTFRDWVIKKLNKELPTIGKNNYSNYSHEQLYRAIYDNEHDSIWGGGYESGYETGYEEGYDKGKEDGSRGKKK